MEMAMKIIDLRSDTVTKPTDEMRQAMAKAEVGDDVYGEDPTINRLQQMAAEMMGKEAGLFVSSGTMGNLLSVLSVCHRGDEVIMGNMGHTFLFEAGGISALGGVFPNTLPNQADGSLRLEDIEAAIRPDDIHDPISRMVILENTHNRCGGTVLSPQYTQAVADLAHQHHLHLHLDGARVFNAAVALGIPAAKVAEPADSVTFCLSKGLCAPVGSVVCGSRDFIQQGRRIRKMLGGGMRQAGILAAAGIVALEKMIPRLQEDHAKAKRLADSLREIPGIVFEMGFPQSNMVFPSLSPEVPLSTQQVIEKLGAMGIRLSAVANRRFRLVTHYWISEEDVTTVIKAFEKVLAA
jgi:threonine aldolase